MRDPATLEQWFTRRRRACLRKWRWLVALAVICTLVAVGSLSLRSLSFHLLFGNPDNQSVYLDSVQLWVLALASHAETPCTACAAVCGVALATLVSLAQIPPTEVQLPFAKHELAYRLRANLRANSWLWIGCTTVLVYCAGLLWAVDVAVVMLGPQWLGFLRTATASMGLVGLSLALVLLYAQTYAVVMLRRIRAPAVLYALPLLCVVGLYCVSDFAGIALISLHASEATLVWAIPLVNGLIAAALLLACWVLDRMTLVECRRLVEEPR